MFLFNKEGRGGGGAQSQIGEGFFFSFFFFIFFWFPTSSRSVRASVSSAVLSPEEENQAGQSPFSEIRCPLPSIPPRCSSSLKSDCHIHFLPCCGISGIRHATAFRIIVFRSTVDGDRTCSHSPAAAGTLGASGLIPNSLTGLRIFPRRFDSTEVGGRDKTGPWFGLRVKDRRFIWVFFCFFWRWLLDNDRKLQEANK